MMEILDLAFDFFVIWLLYKIIFEFVVPLFRSAKDIRNKVQQAHVRMQEHQYQQSSQEAYQRAATAQTSSGEKEGEYIDFEEVKDQ